jgi:hypothetical protein
MVKSESIGHSFEKPELSATVAQARQQLEKRLGTQSEVIRHNPDPVLRDALRVQR